MFKLNYNFDIVYLGTSQINQQLRDMWKSVPTEDKSVSLLFLKQQFLFYFSYFQRWVHKAKRLLEREGLDDSSSVDTKILIKKPSAEIIDNLITDTNNSIK